MIRPLMLALAGVALASPALAEDIRIDGQPRETVFSVHDGDTIVTAKPLRERSSGSVLTSDGKWWTNRTNGRRFGLSGATKLSLTGKTPGGYVYSVVDGEPIPAPELAVDAPARPTVRYGVNLSGCTFVAGTSLCPVKADVDWYAAAGFTDVRLPVSNANLTDPKQLAVIADLVGYIQAKGMGVLLDRHDFKRHSAEDALAFWQPILPNFSVETMIELANEPVHNYPAGSNVWMVSAQDTKETVLLFRQRGIRNPILFGWPGYSATFRTDKREASTKAAESILTAIDRVGGIHDPLGLTFMSGHRYLDKGSSGTNRSCDPAWPNTDGGIAKWAADMRARGMKGMLTEYAFGNYTGISGSCLIPARNVMAAIAANGDVIPNVFGWGGGRAWKDNYIFAVAPKGHQDPNSVNIRVLTGH